MHLNNQDLEVCGRAAFLRFLVNYNFYTCSYNHTHYFFFAFFALSLIHYTNVEYRLNLVIAYYLWIDDFENY